MGKIWFGWTQEEGHRDENCGNDLGQVSKPVFTHAAIALATVFMGLSFSPAANAFVIISADVSTLSGAPLSAIPVGDRVTLDITLFNDSAQQGLQAVAQDYDTAILGFESGASVQEYFASACIPLTGCFGGITNFGNSGSTMNGAGPSELSPGVVQFAFGLVTSPVANSGLADVGLGGDTIANGDIHATLTFEALAPGTTTITLIENAFCVENSCPAIYPQFGSFSSTLTVIPEPGTALLMGLGLTAISGIHRRRR